MTKPLTQKQLKNSLYPYKQDNNISNKRTSIENQYHYSLSLSYSLIAFFVIFFDNIFSRY